MPDGPLNVYRATVVIEVEARTVGEANDRVHAVLEARADEVECWVAGVKMMGPAPLDALPELCPMGCGRTTEDTAGGPCAKCWEKV